MKDMKKHMKEMEKHREKEKKYAIITIAAYKHENWVKVLDMEGDTDEICRAKEKLATRVEKARIRLDGLPVTNWLTTTERDWT